MVARYDIFKKIDASVLWVEAVEDIVTVKKRLLSLGLRGMDDYCVWDSTQQQFIDVVDDRAKISLRQQQSFPRMSVITPLLNWIATRSFKESIYFSISAACNP
jgi:hypothetical protein